MHSEALIDQSKFKKKWKKIIIAPPNYHHPLPVAFFQPLEKQKIQTRSQRSGSASAIPTATMWSRGMRHRWAGIGRIWRAKRPGPIESGIWQWAARKSACSSRHHRNRAENRRTGPAKRWKKSASRCQGFCQAGNPPRNLHKRPHKRPNAPTLQAVQSDFVQSNDFGNRECQREIRNWFARFPAKLRLAPTTFLDRCRSWLGTVRCSQCTWGRWNSRSWAQHRCTWKPTRKAASDEWRTVEALI